jgi:hypothetical protein
MARRRHASDAQNASTAAKRGSTGRSMSGIESALQSQQSAPAPAVGSSSSRAFRM